MTKPKKNMTIEDLKNLVEKYDGIHYAVYLNPADDDISSVNFDTENMEQFGTERILETLRRTGDEPPKKIVAAMNRAVKEFGGDEPQFDDVTMLCVEYKGVREPE
jgi:hypothetical protein